MDLKIMYNKDKSRMQVVLTLKEARYTSQEKMYSTSDIIRELKEKNIVVAEGQCVKSSKVVNYLGPEKCTGSWVFSMPVEKSENTTEYKKTASAVPPPRPRSAKLTKTKPPKKKATKRV